MSLTNTPSANRLHIGIFGKRNSGKSSLLNALTKQEISVVSEVAGTTTDPVYKAMEIHGIGPCMFIDTAGFDDEGELGQIRVEKTKEAVKKTDVALLVFGAPPFDQEEQWLAMLKQAGTPVIPILNKSDALTDVARVKQEIEKRFSFPPLVVSAKTGAGMEEILQSLIRNIPESFASQSIVGHLVKPGDSVLLVMPQDIQAPKGRLILPQVQTIRDLLDHQCVVTSVTTDQLEHAFSALSRPPQLIITDSQAFATVYEQKPKESLLTSFSILFARHKGDISAFVAGASAIQALTEDSHVLIAEACTHAPLQEDIGRVKLPRLLRKRIGEGLTIELVSGPDFPQELSQYDLIIHCGACMFNRKYVLSRIAQAKAQGVPITNYGVALASLTGILDKVVY